MKETIIVAIEYKEPEWEKTDCCLSALDIPIILVDRKGVGSMAKSYNQGFKKALELYPKMKYVWFVSNVTFNKIDLVRLTSEIRKSKYAALHPAFDSDHEFCKVKDGVVGVKPAPFIEFTCPIVRADVFKKFQLNENMPYWGHDLDWGYRVREAGYSIGVLHGYCKISHVYIRNSEMHDITRERLEKRTATDKQTVNQLKKLYGNNWRRKTGLMP